MPNTYYPNGTIPTVGNASVAPVAIGSSTNTSPIQITTTLNGSTPGPHGLATGDNVEISGHTLNTSANGLWQVTVNGPNTFTLNGSGGVGIGGRTGNVHGFTVYPSLTLPSGADNVTALSVNQFAEGIANGIPFSFLNSGKYRLVDQYYLDNTGTGTPWVAWGGAPVSIGAFNSPQACALDIFNGTFTNYVNPPGVAIGDILDIDLITDVNVTIGSGGTYGAPGYALQVGIGTTFGTPDSNPTVMSGSLKSLGSPFSSAAAGYIGHVHLRTVVPVPGFLYSQFDVWMMANAYSQIATGAPPFSITIQPSGIFSLIVNHYRLNGIGT